MVIQGRSRDLQVRPGQISDPTSGFATAKGYETQRGGATSLAPTPILGGGKTPLLGDRKVHAQPYTLYPNPDPNAAGWRPRKARQQTIQAH